MSESERIIESTLLKERRALIDSGTDRNSVKICGNSLYVSNAKYGTANGSNFMLHTSVSRSNTNVKKQAQAKQNASNSPTSLGQPQIWLDPCTNSKDNEV